ncbi:hypothetical protein OPU71_08990 [Niveibacterium sp. 24ML]|uniref:hypothetical protein n=1 Tax=Niveibacterium sp. 24ML TaxID=2985512 RepID=UPI00226F8D20|nr:hypothetical protein [Niveibacterium sp. 24ML]MCX9156255.1 hypothetical protein [Niveibacterium sp. 24ML]
MRTLARLLLAAVSAGLLAIPSLRAEEPGSVVVVAGHANTLAMLSREEVTRLYIGERLEGDKNQLKALELDVPPWAREVFYARLLGRTPVQMRALWARLVFSGKGRPPRIVANVDAALKELEGNASLVVFMPADKAAAAQLKPLFAF